jgi:hypothetical protein
MRENSQRQTLVAASIPSFPKHPENLGTASPSCESCGLRGWKVARRPTAERFGLLESPAASAQESPGRFSLQASSNHLMSQRLLTATNIGRIVTNHGVLRVTVGRTGLTNFNSLHWS